ncbi:MAG: hypothetical protein HETSPECPRED_006426 [Heterodermia speciosa]|uniref:F-box domain-containing protein n=1 Tax=Heterodermia speciosa TaxID=116794 RepID=A0A8H3FT06_9LECA|nr:MAG: hypothetical protein HETSPECPRED_006426 [Heterodermia speciosa]
MLSLLSHVWASNVWSKTGEPRSLPAQKKTHSPAAGSTTISNLPSELILQIASWLSSSSAAALALCDHRLFAVLSGLSLAALQANNKERNLFLYNLSKDYIDTFWCCRCEKLHLLTYDTRQKLKAEDRFFRTAQSRCKAKELEDAYEWLLEEAYMYSPCGPKLTREHAQVAINLNRHGFQPEADRFLNCASVTRCGAPGNYLPSGHQFHEFVVLDGQIFARSQLWMFVSKAQSYTLPPVVNHAACDHIDLTPDEENPLRRQLQCKLIHLGADKDSCSSCQSYIRCEVCYTELLVDTKTVRSKSSIKALRTTKWQCVASASLPPELVCGRATALLRDSVELKSIPPQDDIRMAFEREAKRPFDMIWE